MIATEFCEDCWAKPGEQHTLSCEEVPLSELLEALARPR